MIVIAIDPGNTESAVVCIDEFYRPQYAEKLANPAALNKAKELVLMPIASGLDAFVALEQVSHYGTGMPAGRTVFDTCLWSGRFIQGILDVFDGSFLLADVKDKFSEGSIHMIGRKEYVADLCGSSRARDANIIQYLIDRFAPDTPNRGKGTKKDPGWFYGFKADVWQAYALAVYEMDRLKNGGK